MVLLLEWCAEKNYFGDFFFTYVYCECWHGSLDRVWVSPEMVVQGGVARRGVGWVVIDVQR